MTLAHIAPDLPDTAMVNLGMSERDLINPPLGKSYWFHWGDIRHLTVSQVQCIIGDLAAAGQEGAVKFLRVADLTLTSNVWTESKGPLGYSEYAADRPIRILQNIRLQ